MKIKRLLIFSVVFVLLFSGWLIWYLPYVIAEVKNPVAAIFNPEIENEVRPDFSRYGLEGEPFEFLTLDSLRLSGYMIYTNRKPKGTVIALHGYRSNKNKYLPVVKYFTNAGYDFVAIDLRGHNESQGKFTGFSYDEANDVIDLIDYLKKNERLRGEVVLYGHSIGAAAAVLAVGKGLKVKALVLESLFADFREIFPNYLEFYTGFSVKSFSADTGEWLLKRADVEVDSIKPVRIIGKMDSAPVLLIYGSEDRKVPLSHAHKIYSTLNKPKEIVIVKGATHNTLWETGGENYFKQIVLFLDSLNSN